MNGYLGTMNSLDLYDGVMDGKYRLGSLAYRIARKVSDIITPGPATTWFFLDEHPGSINDGFFRVIMEDSGAAAHMGDFPGSNHNTADGFSFADGHAEIHKWLDSRTSIPFNGNSMPFNTPSPNNPDIAWMQQRTSAQVK